MPSAVAPTSRSRRRQHRGSDRALTSKQAARELGISPRTLEAWRRKDFGPRFFRAGSAPRYDPAEIERWKNERGGWETTS